MSNSLFPSLVSYANAAAALGYANAAQKLVAVPGYTQAAYRTVVASPTPTSAYTTAYIQPTGVSPIKVGSETPPFYQNWTGHDVVLLILPGFTFIEKISFFSHFCRTPKNSTQWPNHKIITDRPQQHMPKN